jgi:outer membrane murein-binding lipoprotein Lpp
MGDTMFWLVIVIIAAIILAIGAYFIGRQVESNKQERNQMQKQVAELTAQVANLSERLNGRHLSNRAIAGVEDATAILIDLEVENQIVNARLNNLRDVLSVLRNKPHEYNPDRQSGYKVQREESIS